MTQTNKKLLLRQIWTGTRFLRSRLSFFDTSRAISDASDARRSDIITTHASMIISASTACPQATAAISAHREQSATSATNGGI
jgi:hypothetical protein